MTQDDETYWLCVIIVSALVVTCICKILGLMGM